MFCGRVKSKTGQVMGLHNRHASGIQQDTVDLWGSISHGSFIINPRLDLWEFMDERWVIWGFIERPRVV